MASKNDMTEMLGLLLIVVIALGLTPTIIGSCTDAKYGLSDIDSFKKEAGVSLKCTLDHGYIRAYAAYVTIICSNSSGSYTLPTAGLTYAFTNNGTYTAPANITISGFVTGEEYDITIAYSYLQPAVIVALLNLLPLFWVVLILAVVIVAITKKLKMW